MGRGEEQIVFKVEFVLEKLENKSARDQESEREREREKERWDDTSESDRCCSFPHLGIIMVYTSNVQ